MTPHTLIIGTGIGGLTTAALLLKAGHQVTVLEAHVEGGIGTLADTLADWIRANGGKVLFRQQVEKIEVRGGRATAVGRRQFGVYLVVESGGRTARPGHRPAQPVSGGGFYVRQTYYPLLSQLHQTFSQLQEQPDDE